MGVYRAALRHARSAARLGVYLAAFRPVQAEPQYQLEVELVRGTRPGILRQNELQLGEVVENRELVDMSLPLGHSKQHVEIRLPEEIGRYLGVASTFLAHAEPGTRIPVAVRPSNLAFHPPASPKTPIVMACAGTGLAPFHGFLQERALQKHGQAVGPALLFFGCVDPEVDFLYKDELKAWEDAGIVSVRPAFSQQPKGEVKFVQHRLGRDRQEVEALFQQDARSYVCGDGQRKAPAVRETVVHLYQAAARVSFEDAHSWADELKRSSTRYVADVFA